MNDVKRSAGNLAQRRPPRYPYRAELEMEWGSTLLRGHTRDVSANGIFIEATDTLWVGAGFRARLVLERTVVVDCLVKRIEPGRGMGVTIAMTEKQSQEQYGALMQALSNRLPEK